jgi:hypothetical protein
VLSFPKTTLREAREARELGVLLAVAMGLSGLAAWSWPRKRVRSLAATGAACLYIVLPYFQFDLYVNAGIGELFALIFMPLALAQCDAMHRYGSAVFPLAASLALLVASNPLIAKLFAPLLLANALLPDGQSRVTLPARVFRLAVAAMPVVARCK